MSAARKHVAQADARVAADEKVKAGCLRVHAVLDSRIPPDSAALVEMSATQPMSVTIIADDDPARDEALHLEESGLHDPAVAHALRCGKHIELVRDLNSMTPVTDAMGRRLCGLRRRRSGQLPSTVPLQSSLSWRSSVDFFSKGHMDGVSSDPIRRLLAMLPAPVEVPIGSAALHKSGPASFAAAQIIEAEAQLRSLFAEAEVAGGADVAHAAAARVQAGAPNSALERDAFAARLQLHRAHERYASITSDATAMVPDERLANAQRRADATYCAARRLQVERDAHYALVREQLDVASECLNADGLDAMRAGAAVLLQAERVLDPAKYLLGRVDELETRMESAEVEEAAQSDVLLAEPHALADRETNASRARRARKAASAQASAKLDLDAMKHQLAANSQRLTDLQAALEAQHVESIVAAASLQAERLAALEAAADEAGAAALRLPAVQVKTQTKDVKPVARRRKPKTALTAVTTQTRAESVKPDAATRKAAWQRRLIADRCLIDSRFWETGPARAAPKKVVELNHSMWADAPAFGQRQLKK